MKLKITPGEWFVRTREVQGETVDCFVAAPPTNGMPYDAEILGDDEYREDDGMARKLADAHLIAAAPQLLAALKNACAVAGFSKQAHAAIDKAEGRQPK